MSDLLTSSQFAEYLRVTPKTVLRWRREGKIDATRRTLGGHWRFTTKEAERVRELMEDHEELGP